MPACRRPTRRAWGWTSGWTLARSCALLEPLARHEVMEHHDVAAVLQEQLEIAAAQRAVRPPAILDHPFLERRRGGDAAHGKGIGAHLRRARQADAARLHGSPSPVVPG